MSEKSILVKLPIAMRREFWYYTHMANRDKGYCKFCDRIWSVDIDSALPYHEIWDYTEGRVAVMCPGSHKMVSVLEPLSEDEYKDYVSRLVPGSKWHYRGAVREISSVSPLIQQGGQPVEDAFYVKFVDGSFTYIERWVYVWNTAGNERIRKHNLRLRCTMHFIPV